MWLAKRIQSDVISLVIMTENEDETRHWNEMNGEMAKKMRHKTTKRASERERKREKKEKTQDESISKYSMIFVVCYYIIAILGWKFYGRRLGGTKIFLLVVNCFRFHKLSVAERISTKEKESGKVNRISNASQTLWQQCCDKAWNLYRKSAEDALGHAIGINSLELNANTNIRSNFFFDVLR